MGGGGRTVWNSESKGGLSILEFPKARGGLDEDAARGRVWIFSGITHCPPFLKDPNVPFATPTFSQGLQKT